MKFLLLIFTIVTTYTSVAQELNCQVNVVANPTLDVTTTEREIFKEIEQAVFDFLNETVWTREKYEVEERINCNFQISILEIQGDNYRANMQIQATRPVFNTTYHTTLINFLDEDVNFIFRRGAKFIFAENQYIDNLSSILAFYANYIIGLDSDSFIMKGGDIYFKAAQNIAVLAQSSLEAGWKPSERGRRNRYWLIDNSLHELFTPLRECFYDYHRNGLDKMYENPVQSTTAVKSALEKLMVINSSRPNSINVQNFVRSKRDEIIGIFKDAERKDQTDVVNILKRIDPTNASRYQEILQ